MNNNNAYCYILILIDRKFLFMFVIFVTKFNQLFGFYAYDGPVILPLVEHHIQLNEYLFWERLKRSQLSTENRYFEWMVYGSLQNNWNIVKLSLKWLKWIQKSNGIYFSYSCSILYQKTTFNETQSIDQKICSQQPVFSVSILNISNFVDQNMLFLIEIVYRNWNWIKWKHFILIIGFCWVE